MSWSEQPLHSSNKSKCGDVIYILSAICNDECITGMYKSNISFFLI